LKAIYGMLEAALLWYKTYRKDLEDIVFVFNPYDPCVANKKVQGLQQTIIFHVDDLKLSHKSKSVNDKFEKWLNRTLKTLYLFSTHMTHAWQIRRFKDCNRQSYFMWTT
jgi:hypothetical protein